MKSTNTKNGKPTSIVEHSTHATTEKAVKRFKVLGFTLKRPSVKPIIYSALAWTGKTPRERLHLRVRELAVLAGHDPVDITQSDYEQAKREVTGESILTRQNAFLDAVT